MSVYPVRQHAGSFTRRPDFQGDGRMVIHEPSGKTEARTNIGFATPELGQYLERRFMSADASQRRLTPEAVEEDQRGARKMTAGFGLRQVDRHFGVGRTEFIPRPLRGARFAEFPQAAWPQCESSWVRPH